MLNTCIKSIAMAAPLLSLFAVEVHAGDFCSHGNAVIVELNGYKTQATRLYTGDFNGDGIEDSFCKDVRKDSSNQNRLLEWIMDGKTGEVKQLGWSDWCTHRNSKIRVLSKKSGDILECTDNISENVWTRKLTW